MGELRQYHPSLKISRTKELPKGNFLVIGDSLQDAIVLQNESKMKAVLRRNVKISLPKAIQTSKMHTNRLAIKGVPTDITDTEFIEFLDLNKISYAKAECIKRKKDGRVFPIFRFEINNPTEAEALISQNLVCQVTGIVCQVEEFQSPVSVMQCFNCQSFGHSTKNCRSKQKSAVRTILTKDAQIKKQGNQSVPIVRGHMLRHTKGVRNTKKQAFRQHVVNNQKTYAATVC